MAVTQGHGDPDWSRDETILALELYFKSDMGRLSSGDPAVQALSNLLRALPYHEAAAKNNRFRNPAGVAFKLQNLRSVRTGKGLQNVSSRRWTARLWKSSVIVQTRSNALPI
jgi:5-methylcytosine-specific restriction protein A